MKNKLLSDSGIYLLSTIIQSGIQLLLIPYLTRALSIEDFAKAELFLTSYGLFNILLLFGISTQVYRDVACDGELLLAGNIKKYRDGVYNFLFYNSIVLLSLVLLVYMFVGDEYWFVVLGLISSLVYVYCIFELCIFQIQKKPQYFLYFNMIFSLVNVLVTVLLISYFSFGFKARFLGYFIPSVVFLFVIFLRVKPSFLSVSITEYFKKIVVCFPLFFASIASWITESIDKFMLAELITLTDVAIYSVGYKFGMIMLLLTSAYSRAWMPYVVDNVKSYGDVRKGLFFSSGLILLLCAVYLLVLSVVYNLIVPKEYGEGLMVAVVIGSGYALDGISKLFNAIFITFGRHKVYIVTTIVAGGGNVVFNLIFIPLYGFMGAAYATLLSFILSFFVTLMYYFFEEKAG